MTPKVERSGSTLTFTWNDYDLVILVDRFHESGGRVSAEVECLNQNGGSPICLNRNQLNLLSHRARGELAKRMATLYPKPNWEQIIEYLCLKAIHLYREGETPLRLSSVAYSSPPFFRIKPLVFEDSPTVLFADGGSGKSYLGLASAMIVECGEALGILRGMQGSTLFLDWETDEKITRDRMDRIKRSHENLQSADPWYRRMESPLVHDLPTIQKLIAREDIKFVIIDSLAPATGGEQGPEPALRFFQAIRSLRVSSLIVAHVAKNTETKTIYGSVFFKNLARMVFEVQALQEIEEDVLKIGVFHRKSNLSRLHPPFGFRLSFQGEETALFSQCDIQEDPEFQASLSVKGRIQVALKGGAKTAQQLAEELEIKPQVVRSRLSEGKGKWVVQMGMDGKEKQWGLIARENP